VELDLYRLNGLYERVIYGITFHSASTLYQFYLTRPLGR